MKYFIDNTRPEKGIYKTDDYMTMGYWVKLDGEVFPPSKLNDEQVTYLMDHFTELPEEEAFLEMI